MRIHLLTLALLAACAPAEAATAWQPCVENAAVSCTTIAVPVDWAEPGGERFDMAVARHPATGERRGTVVYLPAGPGSSGVDAVTNGQLLDLLLPKEIVEHFDVVSFDPRGVRRSSPVLCDAGLVAALDRPEPRGQAEFEALLDAQAAVGADCRARTGPVFDHLDSTQVARDVDALRGALGEDRLNVYAWSYGTVVGQMYAERFPGRIRTMVLDAVFDHSVGSDRFAVAGARAGQESFDRFVAWCDSDPACALHGTDIRARVPALFDRATDPGAVTSRIVVPLTQPNLPATADTIAGLESAPAARSATVLVTNARVDAATPYEGARHVVRQLPGAVLLTWDGMGHGAATRTACTREHVVRYLTDATLPAPGTHCPA